MGPRGFNCWLNIQSCLRYCFAQMEKMGILGICCLHCGYLCRQYLHRVWSWLCLSRIAGCRYSLWSATHRQGNEGMVPIGLKPHPLVAQCRVLAAPVAGLSERPVLAGWIGHRSSQPVAIPRAGTV